MVHADIVEVRGKQVIAIDVEWTDRELIRSIPCTRRDPTLKKWVAPVSWASCLQLRGLFGDRLNVGPALALWSQDEMKNRVAPALELREKITRTDRNFDTRLYDYQTSGAAFITTSCDGVLLGDDLGLGKTAQILTALRALAELDVETTLPALVICPNSVKPGWRDQVILWNTPAVPYIVEGSANQRRKILTEAAADPRALVITNIESVRLLSRLAPYGSINLAKCRECDRYGQEGITAAKCEIHPKELNKIGFKTVIVDEAHMLKDPNAKQTRAVWAVAHGPTVKHRWAMTGTPIVNHIGDLWSIMHFISPDEYPTKSRYVDRYALTAWNARGGLDIVGISPSTRDEFYRIFDPRFRRTPKALVLPQLPKVVRPTRWVDMIPKQKRAYKELEGLLITRLDDGSVLIAPNNLTKATRLLQLSSSYADVEWIPDPLEDDPHNEKLIVKLAEPSPKLDAVMEDIHALDGKRVVVAAESRQLIELLAARLDKFKEERYAYGMLTGAVPDYLRNVNKQRFISGQYRIMLMTIKAGGTGVDGLQVADTMFVIQRSWSMKDNLQLDGRVDRIGSEQHDSVTIVDYVTRDTIEETTQYPRLQTKYRRLEEINRDRARLEAVGITADQRYELEREESAVQGAWLGEP